MLVCHVGAVRCAMCVGAGVPARAHTRTWMCSYLDALTAVIGALRSAPCSVRTHTALCRLLMGDLTADLTPNAPLAPSGDVEYPPKRVGFSGACGRGMAAHGVLVSFV